MFIVEQQVKVYPDAVDFPLREVGEASRKRTVEGSGRAERGRWESIRGESRGWGLGRSGWKEEEGV